MTGGLANDLMRLPWLMLLARETERTIRWNLFWAVAMVSILALGILIHMMLHWNWVCGFLAARLARDKKAKIDDGTQTLYGVGLLIVILNLLGLAIAAAALSIRGPS